MISSQLKTPTACEACEMEARSKQEAADMHYVRMLGMLCCFCGKGTVVGARCASLLSVRVRGALRGGVVGVIIELLHLGDLLDGVDEREADCNDEHFEADEPVFNGVDEALLRIRVA